MSGRLDMRIAAYVAGGLCVAAGVYLLSLQSATGDPTWFEGIAHGMGIYFLGKGIFVTAMMLRWAEHRTVARQQLAALEALAWGDEPADAPDVG